MATKCRRGTSDVQVYGQLVAADSHLSVPRRIDWRFLYDDEEHARARSRELESTGFNVSAGEVAGRHGR